MVSPEMNRKVFFLRQCCATFCVAERFAWPVSGFAMHLRPCRHLHEKCCTWQLHHRQLCMKDLLRKWLFV